MKKITPIILFTFLSSLAFSNGDPYTKAMKEGMNMLNKAHTFENYLAAANQFERISITATNKWQPAYYTAYAITLAAATEIEPVRIDELLDQAETVLKKASSLDHDESEVSTLQGFIHMIRIGVDPSTRGQKYSMLSSASLQKALKLNPDNPRAMYMQAELDYGTAQFFGSDTSKACATNDRAIILFEKNEKDGSSDPFAPTWGKNNALSFKKRCTDKI